MYEDDTMGDISTLSILNPNVKYANLVGWTDVTPFEIIKVTAKTLTLRRMKSVLDPAWHPETILGGFAGHTVNNSEQRWIITSDESELIVKAYLRKEGRHYRYYSKLGRHTLNTEPVRFYDYNF
jgi:hypothetical protein